MKKQQIGVGLMAVLVALTLLAIGALGFVAIQYRAVEASIEANNRIQAMNIARDLTERIRANRNGYAKYQENLNAATQVTISTPSCLKTDYSSPNCTANQLANYDTAEIVTLAQQRSLTITMPNCAGSLKLSRSCIYIAWGETKAINSDTDTKACTKGGSYLSSSQCIVLEAF